MMTDEEARELVDKTMECIKAIHPIIRGKGPEVQGAVIADLLGTYLAGHPPEAREEVLKTILTTAQNLIPITERAMGNVWEGGRTIQ